LIKILSFISDLVPCVFAIYILFYLCKCSVAVAGDSRATEECEASKAFNYNFLGFNWIIFKCM